ncbi:hypothetical protein ACS0TY_026583 [Phlomoides rotata]
MPRTTNLGFLIVATAALILSATATIHHPTPRYRLRKRHLPTPPSPPPEPPSFVPEFDWEQEEYLKAHNEIRQRVGVPPLVWDANLTAESRNWAELRRGDCNYRHHSPSKYGESIFFMNYKEFTPKDVVQWWYNEHTLYDHLTHRCLCIPQRAGCECGHYLNIVWSTTRRVGCSGATYCNDQKGIYVVCQYDPPGLLPGVNPFTGIRL